MEEELVYRQRFFDGKGYGGKGHPDGFTPKSEDIIYLIADHDNAISARMSLVYFWPLTGKYRANWEGLNEEVKGTLEILKDKKVIESLEKESNCVYYPEGATREVSFLYGGEKAERMRQAFEEMVQRYYMVSGIWKRKLNEYNEKNLEFTQEMEKLKEKWRETGEEPSEEEIEKLILSRPERPEPPEPPEFFITEVRKDYMINLPQGSYEIRIRAEDGAIVQGSQKNLLLFIPRKTGAIGYQIVPGNRWAQRESCFDPAKIVYLEGENTLYFLPFYQDEYNEFYYNKLLDGQNFGREKKWIWISSKSVKDGSLLFSKKGKTIEKIKNIPYYAKEIRDENLEQRGFDIVEYKEEEVLKGTKPTFEGHKLHLSSEIGKKNYQIHLEVENADELVKRGEREIRFVKKSNPRFLYLFALFPLVIGLASFIQRRKKLK